MDLVRLVAPDFVEVIVSHAIISGFLACLMCWKVWWDVKVMKFTLKTGPTCLGRPFWRLLVGSMILYRSESRPPKANCISTQKICTFWKRETKYCVWLKITTHTPWTTIIQHKSNDSSGKKVEARRFHYDICLVVKGANGNNWTNECWDELYFCVRVFGGYFLGFVESKLRL